MPNPLRSSNGSALVMMLAITLVLFLGCMMLLSIARENIRAAQSLMDKLQAQLRAETLIEQIKFVGATGKFGKNTLENIVCKAFPIARMPVDGTPLQVQPDAWLKITDAGAKLNIQNLQPNDLARILQNMGIPDQKTRIVEDSLLDWYDKDDLKRLNGAEDYYYRSEIRAAFGPRNSRSPETVAELSLVRGLNDPSIWRQIRPYLVLAPGVMQNINTMGKEMLMALLDISSEVADDLLSLRRSRGFLVLPEVTATAGLRTGLILDNLAAFSSQIIEIEVEAGCGNAREILHCVISFRPDEMTPFTVLEFSY